MDNVKQQILSLKGKFIVVNNLALPPLLYVVSVIHTLDIVFKEVKTIIRDFLGDCKPSKIAYDTLIQPICKDIQNYWSEARTIDNTNIKVEMIQDQVIWNN